MTSLLAYTLYAVLCQYNFMLIFETSLELLFCVIILICAIVFRDKKVKNGIDNVEKGIVADKTENDKNETIEQQ